MLYYIDKVSRESRAVLGHCSATKAEQTGKSRAGSRAEQIDEMQGHCREGLGGQLGDVEMQGHKENTGQQCRAGRP